MTSPYPAIEFKFAPRYAWTAICRADDPHKSIVDQGGALLYDHRSRGFESWSFDLVIAFAARAGSAPTSIEQSTESARRGIVVTTVTYARQRLVLRQFGHLDEDGRRIDVVAWDIECTDDDDAVVPPLLAGLQIDLHRREPDRLSSGYQTGRTVRRLAEGSPDVRSGWPDDTEPVDDFGGDGDVVFVSTRPVEPSHVTGFRPGDGFGTVPVLLAPGEHVRGAISVPLDGRPVPVTLARADAALDATRRYWDGLELRRVTVTVPDPAVQDMIDASTRNLLQAREMVDGVPQLQVGPVVYRGLWVIDGHFMMECARYLGLDDAADAGMTALLRRVRDDGSIVESLDDPHIKETGIAVASIVREAELTGDLELLRARWHLVADAGRFIDVLVEQSLELSGDHPLHGIMPIAFGDGGLAGARAELTSIMWVLTGLRYARDAAELLGTDDRDAHSRRFANLSAAFEARRPALMEATADGRPYLPQNLPLSGMHTMLPDVADAKVARHRRVGPGTATWAFCHAIWPGELFDAADPAVTALLNLFDDTDDIEGIPTETGWLPYEALWPYYSSFAAHAWLFAGRGDKAADYLYSFADHAYPTRVWREEQALQRADNDRICGDMPHNWASTEFIRLAIHLLAFEKGDDLLVLAGLPDSWRDGILLTDHPTRFGRVSLELAVIDGRPGVRRLTVEVTGPAWRAAHRVRVRLPQDVHTVVAADAPAVELPIVVGDGRWIDLEPSGRHELWLS